LPRAAGLKRGDRLDAVAFYDKPITKFTRLLTTLCETAPSGFKAFTLGVPGWVKEKGWISYSIDRVLHQSGIKTINSISPNTTPRTLPVRSIRRPTRMRLF
jgi:carbamoyltransferase